MTSSVVARFLFGDSDAIRAVAGSRAAFWTGLLLVLLTAIARNYDQTFILEKPILWLFGPLMFSLFSGTWVFMVAYGIAWGYMGPERRALWKAWPAFMGLFWMTAPIAWLYAIPVERFLDSITAARVNAALLLIVSIWRVLLVARVFQVLHGAPFLMALAWILIPATVEVLGISIFGGGLSKRIMAGMMGMRNSPEEEILLRSMGVATNAALCLLPLAILVAVACRMKTPTTALPESEPGRIPVLAISTAAVFWIAIAIVPQRELMRNNTFEKMLKNREYRQALDYLSSRHPSDFAPARTLSPKPFEGELFEQLPPLVGAVIPAHSQWVHEHLLHRLTQMCDHFKRAWDRSPDETASRDEQIKRIGHGIQWAQRFAPLGGVEFVSILRGLNKIPAAQQWLSTNQLFLAAVAQYAAAAPVSHVSNRRDPKAGEVQRAEWNALLAHLEKLGITNWVSATAKSNP